MQGRQSQVNSDSTYQFNLSHWFKSMQKSHFNPFDLLINSILIMIKALHSGDDANSSVWVKLIQQKENSLTMHFLKCVKIKQESKKPACV